MQPVDKSPGDRTQFAGLHGVDVAEAVQLAIAQVWSSVVITSADRSAGFPVIYANPAFCSMTGYPLHELLGRSLNMLQGPDTDQKVIAHLSDCLRRNEFFEGTTYNYKRGGEKYLVHWTISPVLGANGRVKYYISVQADITDQVKGRRELAVLHEALQTIPDPIFITDSDFVFSFTNAAFDALLTGERPANLRDLVLGDAGRLLALVRNVGTSTARDVIMVGCHEDTAVHLDVTASVLGGHASDTPMYLFTGKDVTGHVVENRQLSEAAMIDALTGALNRRSGELVLERARQRPEGDGGAIVMCDLDRFKDINDSHGHLVGDRALQNVAKVLRAASRKGDSVIRWGGDEFVVLLDGASPETAQEIAERIRMTIASHQDADYGRLTVSIGVANLPRAGALAEVLARVDAAMYAAKQAGRDKVVSAG